MYDAIVVGARCAGAPTALLLARKGYKVLLLDRGTFPSDMPFLQPLRTPDRLGAPEALGTAGRPESLELPADFDQPF